MNGNALWLAVRREFKRQFPKGTIHRVENTLERGMSDVVWCAGGLAGWIELKGEGDWETPIQRSFRRKWNKACGLAAVLTYKHGKFILTEWNNTEEFETLEDAIICIVGG